MSLASLGYDSVSVLNSFEVYCLGLFYRMTLNLSLAVVFITVRLGLWGFGRKTTEMKCHTHHSLTKL